MSKRCCAGDLDAGTIQGGGDSQQPWLPFPTRERNSDPPPCFLSAALWHLSRWFRKFAWAILSFFVVFIFLYIRVRHKVQTGDWNRRTPTNLYTDKVNLSAMENEFYQNFTFNSPDVLRLVFVWKDFWLFLIGIRLAEHRAYIRFMMVGIETMSHRRLQYQLIMERFVYNWIVPALKTQL